MFLLICVIIVICFSIIDFSGLKFHIQKQYRTSPYLRHYQIINGILELIFALCGIFYILEEKIPVKENSIILVGFLMIAVMILRGLNSRYFIKKSQNK